MFEDYPSYPELVQLAEKAYDLAKNGVDPARINAMSAEAHGIELIYAFERVSEKVMTTLYGLAEEAKVFDKMVAMQAGEVINKIEGHPSEERRVLHMAMRDFFGSKNPHAVVAKATELAYQECEKLTLFLDEIEKKGFTDLIQIGIGGSDLGPRAIYLALKAFKRPDRRVHFISNIDPDDAHAVLDGLDLKKTLVVVVSKSGSTLETLTNEELVKKRFIEAGLAPKEHFIAVTEKGSPMDDPQFYLASFYIWDYIGGRYSVTSMVGGVALAFALGMEKFLDFLRGANCMDKTCLEKELHKNLPLIGALLGIWNRNFLGCPTLAVIPYSQAMSRFAAHIQQLDMESNGKQIDKEGRFISFGTAPIIWGEPGTNGQHSFYQCIHQGRHIVPLEFIGFKMSQYGDDLLVEGTMSQEKLLANLFAQALALSEGQSSDNPNKVFLGNRPSHLLLAKKCDPFTLGALLSYFENKVVFQGFIWGINSFDQEGVQLGKVLAKELIGIYQKKRAGEEVDAKAMPSGQVLISRIEKL